jgi:hypothetical protein
MWHDVAVVTSLTVLLISTAASTPESSFSATFPALSNMKRFITTSVITSLVLLRMGERMVGSVLKERKYGIQRIRLQGGKNH